MPNTFWTTSGTIEGIGNGTLAADGTTYSVIRVRRPDGTMQSLTDVVAARHVDLALAMGAQVSLTGFDLEGRSVLVGVLRDGEVLSDIEAVEHARRTLRRVGRWTLAMAAVFGWTVIVPAVLLFPALRALRNARAMPSRAEMQRAVGALK